jgi:hypothetical protein
VETQVYDDDGSVTYAVYANAGKGGFLNHFDPGRLAVPRIQNWFRVILWLIFLIACACPCPPLSGRRRANAANRHRRAADA